MQKLMLKKMTFRFFNWVKGNFYARNISIALLSILGLFILIIIFLRLYTNHGQALSVPDLNGMTVEEVKETLGKRKLRFEITDSVYITDKDKGVVVDQLPTPEFKVKKHRTIFLTVNANTPEKVVMPNVVGFSVRQARAVLETRGLSIGRLIYVPDVATNYVLQQKVKGKYIIEGDTLIKGTMVDLEIGNGLSNKKTRVPNLLKKNFEQAKRILNENFLNLGAPIFDNTVITKEDSSDARIFRQKPEHSSGIMLPLGSFVDIWMTMDSTKMPDYDSLLNKIEYDQNNYYDLDLYEQ